MKKTFTLIFAALLSQIISAQTFTYSNFALSLSDTLPVNVANNASFNSSLTSISGSSVTWDASGLTLMGGYPTVNLSFHPSSSTPNGALYPSSNYSEFDPALTAVVAYNYFGISNDSVVEWGSYNPDTKHEIFQNPDKHLIFPFTLGQTFTDTYKKTNYSDATTISSIQTGTRTVTFLGHGNLILPQGTFSNVGLIAETRTNSLGPDSYYYTWYDISNGKKLLYRSENGSSITTVFCSDIATGIIDHSSSNALNIYPNPTNSQFKLELIDWNSLNEYNMVIYNSAGIPVLKAPVQNKTIDINRNDLPSGTYFVQITSNGTIYSSKKLIIL